MVRPSRVSEHLDTKSVTKSASLLQNNTLILEKWRPPGRSNSRRVTKRALPDNRRVRGPVSLGDVKWMFHPSVSLSGSRKSNLRSSRRGKEKVENFGGGKGQVERLDGG